MYSEKRIREILHEYKMQRKNLSVKISIPELREKFWPEYNSVSDKIILLQTILEESKWQKLMNEDKKIMWFKQLFCWHEWLYKERAYNSFKICKKCEKVK